MIKIGNINTYTRTDGELVFTCSVIAPLYFWDTLSVVCELQLNTVTVNLDKEFTREDFSFDYEYFEHSVVDELISELNDIRDVIINFDTYKEKYKFESDVTKERIRKMLIQLLPLSYNTERTVIIPCKEVTRLAESLDEYTIDEFTEFVAILQNAISTIDKEE